MNSTPSVRQYDILSNRWGDLLCQEENRWGGWIKEERFLDFNPAIAKDVPNLFDEYVHYYNYERPAAALGYKSPVQYKTELGF